MRYSPTEVHVDPRQEDRLKSAIVKNKSCSVRIFLTEPQKRTMLLTKGQIERIERAQLMGKDRVSIKLTVPQIKANTEHTGGFLWSLASALGPALLRGAASLGPALLRGAASAVASKGIEKLMKGKGLFLQKNGHCGKVQTVNGGGLYLSPHPRVHGGEGLFEADGNTVGGGLLFGDNTFNNVPLLNILL